MVFSKTVILISPQMTDRDYVEADGGNGKMVFWSRAIKVFLHFSFLLLG